MYGYQHISPHAFHMPMQPAYPLSPPIQSSFGYYDMGQYSGFNEPPGFNDPDLVRPVQPSYGYYDVGNNDGYNDPDIVRPGFYEPEFLPQLSPRVPAASYAALSLGTSGGYRLPSTPPTMQAHTLPRSPALLRPPAQPVKASPQVLPQPTSTPPQQMTPRKTIPPQQSTPTKAAPPQQLTPTKAAPPQQLTPTKAAPPQQLTPTKASTPPNPQSPTVSSTSRVSPRVSIPKQDSKKAAPAVREFHYFMDMDHDKQTIQVPNDRDSQPRPQALSAQQKQQPSDFHLAVSQRLEEVQMPQAKQVEQMSAQRSGFAPPVPSISMPEAQRTPRQHVEQVSAQRSAFVPVPNPALEPQHTPRTEKLSQQEVQASETEDELFMEHLNRTVPQQEEREAMLLEWLLQKYSPQA